MRRLWFISILLIALLLTGCQPKLEEGVTVVVSESHFFDTTPVPASSKDGDSEAQAKLVITPTNVPAYPTPLATYLVPSRLVTVPAGGQTTSTAVPTSTQTRIPTIQPTSTTGSPTLTATVPAATAVKTNTPTTAPTTAPTIAPTSASTATGYLYAVQSGSPVQIQNFVNSAAGCAWQGIAGQVFDNEGTPVKNIVVKAGGTWNGASVNLLGMTGTAANYGEGGYELVLGTKVVTSNKTVWVQLYDLTGTALTEKVYISTSTDCTKNLVLLNFKAIAGGFDSYVPMVVQTTTP